MDSNTEYSIFLHIIEGIGFNEKNEDIILDATLNGVKLEVEGHNTENSTIFNSNCIWECMFDDLKRMKTDNRPIKIECFHKVRKNDKEVRKAIGFVLLPIRSLQVVKSLRNVQIKVNWHKLCGLAADWRPVKPELYLSALITTKVIMESGQLEDNIEPVIKPVDSADSVYIRPSETSLMLKSQLGIYIKLLEDECLLQVGNGPNDCDTFIVTLLLKSAKNLDQLVGHYDSENPTFRFHYDFLGGPGDLLLSPNIDGVYNIHEKISVNFKTSLESLRDYFKRVFYIPMDLYYNDSIIGNYKFTCADLLPSSLDTFNDDDMWEVKNSFTIQTLFDVFETSARPTVEYTFSLNYIPMMSSPLSQAHSPSYIDKRARGDMGDTDFFELPPTTETTHRVAEEEPEVRSVTHRIEREREKVTKQCRSETLVSCRQEKEEPSAVDDIAYEVIAELEDWKCQQIDDFLVELKRKEIHHLGKLSAEWERQKQDIAQKLQEKLDECARLTESLEAAHAVVREKSARQYEEERGFEKTKHELDKRYTVRFMEIEEKARRIKDDMEYELKVQELRFKELEMDKAREAEENAKLRAKVAQLKEELEEMRKNTLPREQLTGLFEDLRHQSERYIELEKSKRFYKDQWGKLAKEVHRLKLHALRIQEEKLKQTNCLGLDNIMDLQSMIFQERTALLTDRSELKTVKDALTWESDVSTSNCES